MSITRFRCERDVLRPLADVAHYKWSAVVYTLTGDTLILSSPMGDELGRMTVGGELDGRFEINDWRMLNALEDMPHNAVEVEVVRGSLTEVIAITDRDRKRVWRWQLRGTVRGGEQ